MGDGLKMDGNCKDAPSGVGKNEFYPCWYNNGTNFGASIGGLLDPKNITYHTSLFVNKLPEPNVRTGELPVKMVVEL